MPFPPSLVADEANTVFVGTFQAYLSSGSSPARGDDFPDTEAGWFGAIGESELSSTGAWARSSGDPACPPGNFLGSIDDASVLLVAGSRYFGIESPRAFGYFWGGFLGYVGGVGFSDTTLPTPPVPSFGPTGEPTSGAAGNAYPPTLGTDPAPLTTGSLFSGTESFSEPSYFLGVISGFIGQSDTAIGTPPMPFVAIANNPAPRPGSNDPIATFQAYLVASPEGFLFPPRLAGASDIVDQAAGPLGKNQNSDPAGSQAQLDGQFDAFVGQVQPPFTSTRLPRLAFGPFLNLEGLTYEIELDAFAKFGLTQIQYRIYANDQPTPPFNVINLAGQASYTTSLILTLDNASATLQADAILTDSFGNVASQSVVLPGVPDTVPPTAPPFLYVAQLPDGSWLFVWGTSSDNFVVDHYQLDQVDQNGAFISTLAPGLRQNYFLWNGPAAGNHYRVLAFDPPGNVSPSSPIALAVANQAAGPQVSGVLAQQVPGTSTVQVNWTVTPLGASCVAEIVDAQDDPVSAPVTSQTGRATLTLPTSIGAGIYRVKVTAS